MMHSKVIFCASVFLAMIANDAAQAAENRTMQAQRNQVLLMIKSVQEEERRAIEGLGQELFLLQATSHSAEPGYSGFDMITPEDDALAACVALQQLQVKREAQVTQLEKILKQEDALQPAILVEVNIKQSRMCCIS